MFYTRLQAIKMPFLPFAQLFFSISIMFATWIIYIPHIIEKLHMSKGQLGTALMFSALGALVANPIAKRLVNKFGPGKMALFSVPMQSIIIVGYFIAPSAFWLSALLFMFGLCGSITQIAVNTLITIVEKQKEISIMSTSHGFWSLGGIIASGAGTLLLIAIGNPLVHILLSASIVFILQLIFAKKYINIKGSIVKSTEKKQTNVYKNLLIWGLALIGICVMVSEGAIADWSALYLRDVALTNSQLLGLGYAGFSLAMAIGRFLGDHFSKRIGSMQIIISGFIIGCFGLLTVLMASPVLSVIGFFIIGLGFSVIVPEVYRMAASVSDHNASSGIAMISIAANFGFLVGPFTMGAIAEKFGLQISYIALLGLVLAGTAISIVIRMRTRAKYSIA